MPALNAVWTAVPAMLLAACTGDPSMSLDEVLRQHTVARGGAAAIEAVQSLQLTLEIEEATFRVRGEYAATRDGYMRIDIYDDDTAVFTEALGPDGGWQVRRAGAVAEDLSEEGEQALRRGLFKNLYGLHELPALGYELYHHGSVTQDDRDFQVLEVKAPDDHVEYLYLDADSLLVERELEKAALHPDVDPAEVGQLTRHDDFRRVAGVVFSHRARTFDLDQDTVMQSTVITRIAVNAPYDEARFRRP